MGETTAIEWCDHTFNPWIGCTKVSPACDHCYAEALMDTRYGRVTWGAGEDRVRTGASNWRQPVKWNKAADQGLTVGEFIREAQRITEADYQRTARDAYPGFRPLPYPWGGLRRRPRPRRTLEKHEGRLPVADLDGFPDVGDAIRADDVSRRPGLGVVP